MSEAQRVEMWVTLDKVHLGDITVYAGKRVRQIDSEYRKTGRVVRLGLEDSSYPEGWYWGSWAPADWELGVLRTQ